MCPQFEGVLIESTVLQVDPDPGAKERSQFRDTLLERYGDTAPAALAQLWRSLETEPVPTHPTESATRGMMSSIFWLFLVSCVSIFSKESSIVVSTGKE